MTSETIAPGAGASDLRETARDASVIWLGLFALGIGFGVVVTSHGLPWWLAPIISGLMYAGSVEFILVGMLAVRAPVAAIALTTFLINSRAPVLRLVFPAAPSPRTPRQGLQRLRAVRRGLRPHHQQGPRHVDQRPDPVDPGRPARIRSGPRTTPTARRCWTTPTGTAS